MTHCLALPLNWMKSKFKGQYKSNKGLIRVCFFVVRGLSNRYSHYAIVQLKVSVCIFDFLLSLQTWGTSLVKVSRSLCLQTNRLVRNMSWSKSTTNYSDILKQIIIFWNKLKYLWSISSTKIGIIFRGLRLAPAFWFRLFFMGHVLSCCNLR